MSDTRRDREKVIESAVWLGFLTSTSATVRHLLDGREVFNLPMLLPTVSVEAVREAVEDLRQLADFLEQAAGETDD